MDSVLTDDQTLPVDMNGSCRLPDSLDAGDYTTSSMTAPSFPDKMSPSKALTMKEYENQITALKKENFNLKLRIYFLEDRMQQKCDDSTEDIFKTNIELKVELESMKREMAEKHTLLVSASKALESLADRDTGDPQRIREQAQREMDALRDTLHKKMAELEQSLRTAEEEVERMASIAEQEQLKNFEMEKQLLALGVSSASAFNPVPFPTPADDQRPALQEKDNITEQLRESPNGQVDAVNETNRTDHGTDSQTDYIRQLTIVNAEKDQQLQALRDDLGREKDKTQRDYEGFVEKESEVRRLETTRKLLNDELTQMKNTNESLTKTLDEAQNQNKVLSGKLEEKDNELCSEKKNSLKRDKTIQGLTHVLKEKEKEISELCHEIEDRDDALAKARDAAHKAQLQKFQGAEEQQSLLMDKQAELAQLQGEHHTKVLEAQKLQRSLLRKEQELADLQQAKDQLEVELEDLQQQKKKGDKALNDLQNQLKKLSAEIGDKDSALEQQYQERLNQTTRMLQAQEVTIQRLTSSLAEKEQQLQEYMNMAKDFEQSRSPGGSNTMVSKLRERLKEKEKALETALDEKFAAIEEKDNEIYQLQLSLREKERDVERLTNLLSHNNETINSFDCLIKEKDVELQHLANTLKNLQRTKQDVEDNLNRSLREKDSIISQLQLSLQGKTKDMEEMAETMLNQSQTQARDLAEQMGQRLKVTEAMLAEAVKARDRLVSDNESAVEGLLFTISSKDKLLKDSAEHYNRMLSGYTQEIQELKRQLCDRQQQLATAEKHGSSAAQEGYLEAAELRALLSEKDRLINKLFESGQERDQFLVELRQKGDSDHVLELRQTIQVLQGRLEEREAELSRKNNDGNIENSAVTKKTVIILKKELGQKTEALNKALKRENDLKMSLAELQSMLTELEGHNKGQLANIESLTSTLDTKDEIIRDLHQRLGRTGDVHYQSSGSGVETSMPILPQRERTVIGGDSQQKVFPNLSALHEEHEALNRALRSEQQLYSSLVRTVKEQDSSQRLHALQLELTAVQLLRQQLEEGVKTNEQLKDDLEREIHRAELREGVDLVDPNELESMRHQLEDAQRWNASLQVRLGAIQNRGGGVGGANDTGDTMSFIADQTSYMSICVGEGFDGLPQFSSQELRQKECINRLQVLNEELQRRLSLLERTDNDPSSREDQSMANPGKQQLEKRQEEQQHINRAQDKQTQTDVKLGQMVSENHLSVNVRGSQVQTGEHFGPANDTWENVKKREGAMLKSLLGDCGATSTSQLREELFRLRSENGELLGLLKEEKSAESKEKESRDTSGDSSDGQGDLSRTVERLRAEAQGHHQVIRLLKEQLEKKARAVSEGETQVTTKQVVSIAKDTEGQQTKSSKQHVTRYGAGVKSRLPVLVRPKTELSAPRGCVSRPSAQPSDDLNVDSLLTQLSPEHCEFPRSLQHSTPTDSNTDHIHDSGCPAGSDHHTETQHVMEKTDSALFIQLELLHQECQEKETLINALEEKLANWEELHSQPQEKGQLNSEYIGALQAAESTIAYLTACNLDSQTGLGSHSSSVPVGLHAALQRRCTELQQALQDKEKLNSQLVEFIKITGQQISSFKASTSSLETTETLADAHELFLKLQSALQQMNASLGVQSPALALVGSHGLSPEQRQHTDSPRQAQLERSRINTEFEKRVPADDTLQPAHNNGGTDQENDCTGRNIKESLLKDESGDSDRKVGSSGDIRLNLRGQRCLLDCLKAAESAIASLTAHCANASSSLTSDVAVQTSPTLKQHLHRLQKALQEMEKGEDMGQTKHIQQTNTVSNNLSAIEVAARFFQELYHSVHLLYKAFSDHSQRISELRASQQDEQGGREENEPQATEQNAKRLPLKVQAQLKSLPKEKTCACKRLEEKLPSTQSVAIMHNSSKKPSHDTAQKVAALEQDDKCVQVDLSDLGYETSGKSEIDREESSSTDLGVGVQPGSSACSLPSLLKDEQATFSSTENLDSASNTSYPSSPAFSSHKVTLKSVHGEYGVSEDPVELQAQVRELRVQLEGQTRVILQMQSLLRRNSLPVDPVSSSIATDQARKRREGGSQGSYCLSGELKEEEEGESQLMKDEISHLTDELERERSLNRSVNEQLQQAHHRSRSASPARLDSLVQSQARELSQLRQQIKDSRGLGALQRQQLEELSKAFKELLQASDADLFRGGVLKEQLDKSLSILERLEGQLEKDSNQDNEDGAALDLAQSPRGIQEIHSCPQDSQARIQQEIEHLRWQLEGERELLQQHLRTLAQQNYNLAESSKEQLELLSKELQEKNRLIQSLQSQLGGQSPSSHHSSHSDLSQSYMASASCRTSPTTHSGYLAPHGQRDATDGTGTGLEAAIEPVSPVGGAKAKGVLSHGEHGSRLQGLQRENGRLQQQLRNSEDLNATLRSELDLHCSIAAQAGLDDQKRSLYGDPAGLGPQVQAEDSRRPASQQDTAPHTRTMNPDLLAEHLQEIRALRQRLEETIHTNDRLREQLEIRLAEVEKDPATNIFIQGTEEQGQLANEVRFLWEQNHSLKEQLSQGSRDKHKENDKLREALARRTAKLEQSRKDCEALRQDNIRLQDRVEHSDQEHTQLQDSLHRLQCKVKLQRQQLSDSQHLLQSLRVELQVHEQMRTGAQPHAGSGDGVQDPGPGPMALAELLAEIRCLRLQLERSIQTNTALRQRLEQQLLREPHRPDTININYLLATSDEGGHSPGRENCDLARHSSHTHHEHTGVEQETKRRAACEEESSSQLSSSSSGESAPSRLVPGHRLFAHRHGRHVLALIEDHNALRKQISEGRQVTRSMDAQLQECTHKLKQLSSDKALEQHHLKTLSSSVNTMQQVLEEAGRLLKLVWRVALPAAGEGDGGGGQQDDLLKNEIARLKSRLSQQENMLSGAVKRLRSTNQLKEGMERVIIDQLALTHGVLKKARGNLEEVPVNGH